MNTTLWMGDVETFWDENFIRGAFAQSGEQPSAVKLMKNKLTGGQARYCFVDFRDSAAAERVMSVCNGKPVPNSTPPRMFKLNFAVYGMQAPPNAEHGDSRPDHGSMNRKEFSLFVGELSPEVDDYALYNFFSRRYPSIKGAKVIMDNAGMSRGFGFVRFGSEDEQQRALNEMQNASGLGGRPLRVSIATPKKPKPPGPGGEGPDPWSSGVGSWNAGGGGGGGNTWNSEGGGGGGSSWNGGGGGGSSWNAAGGGGGGGGGQYGGGSQGSWGGGSQQNTWNSGAGGQGSWESGAGGASSGGAGSWGGGGQQAGWSGGSGSQPSGWGSGGQQQSAGWSGTQDSSWGGGSAGAGSAGAGSSWGQGQGGQQYGQSYQGGGGGGYQY